MNCTSKNHQLHEDNQILYQKQRHDEFGTLLTGSLITMETSENSLIACPSFGFYIAYVIDL